MAKDILQSKLFRFDTLGRKGLINAREYSKITNTPAKHVMHYATSGFEGILGVPGVDGNLYILFLDKHVNRLFKTMEALMITKPIHLTGIEEMLERSFPDRDLTRPIPEEAQVYLNITHDEVKEAIFQTIRENINPISAETSYINPRELVYVRPNVYRDEKIVDGDDGPVFVSGLGVASIGHQAVLEIMAQNVPSYLSSAPEQGARVLVFETLLLPPGQNYQNGIQTVMRKIKSGANYGLGGVAKNTALALGYDEALLLDPNGYVLEGGGENAFAVFDNQLWTPSLDMSILPGTKRALVIEIAREMGINVREGEISLYDFLNADAAAFSGTWCGFEPIWYVHQASTGKRSNYKPNNEIIQTLKREYNYLTTGNPKVDSHLADLSDNIRTLVELK
ncbi:MAG: aminotransferase class IV [Candidatus Woesearchaeota archaeon]